MKEVVISDLDNTLAILNGRDPYKEQDSLMSDEVNPLLLQVLKMYQEKGVGLIFVTGRWENYDILTQKWLEDKGLVVERILSRPLTNYDKATGLKEWYLENVIFQQYIPLLAFDDLLPIIRMYRKHDVPAWWVNSEPWMDQSTT